MACSGLASVGCSMSSEQAKSDRAACAGEPTISVALVEDEAGTRQRLELALARAPRLALAFAASTAGQMLDWLRDNSVDVLLVDLNLPDRSGLDVIRHCRAACPGTEVMVITMFGDEASMMGAFEAGARGYLLKDGTEDDLAHHVLSLHAGGSPMTPIIARQLLARLSLSAPSQLPQTAAQTSKRQPRDTMSAREHDILSKLSRGYTYAEVAALLGIAPSTVQSHVKNIYSKLAVHSKTEAVFEAQQMGLL